MAWRYLVFLIVGFATLPAQAATQAAGHFRLEAYRMLYTVQADARYSGEFDQTFEALTVDGAAYIGKWSFDYSTKLQSVKVLEAETIKADGRHIAVQPAAMDIQTGVLGAVSYPDHARIQITFPDVGVGDRVHLHARLVQERPMVPGVLFQLDVFSDQVLIRQAEVGVDMPPDMPLHFDVAGLESVRDASDASGRHLRWRYRNETIRPLEQAEIDGVLDGAHLIFSNLESWDALARVYADLYRPKAAVTPKVRQRANELTAGVAGAEAKTRVLYDWVRSHIRYVATYVDAGAFEPHPADWVLDNGYGDCKDHVVLLEALLRAAGVESGPVLIANNTDQYRLPAIPTFVFNHLISYVPALDLYLDSTGESIPFGLLPEGDRDKPVIQLYRTQNPYRTPMDGPEQKWLERRTQVTLHVDGALDRQTDIKAGGLAAVWARGVYRQIGVGKEREWAEARLRDAHLTGNANLERLADDGRSQASYRVTQHINNYLGLDEAGLLRFEHAYDGPTSMTYLMGRFFDAGPRTRGGTCVPMRIEDWIDFNLDASIRLLHVPRDRQVSGEGLRFETHYEKTATGFRAHRVLVWSPVSYACTAAQYRALAPIARKIDAARRSAAVYERELPEGLR